MLTCWRFHDPVLVPYGRERARLVIHRRLRNNPKDSRDWGGGIIIFFIFCAVVSGHWSRQVCLLTRVLGMTKWCHWKEDNSIDNIFRANFLYNVQELIYFSEKIRVNVTVISEKPSYISVAINDLFLTHIANHACMKTCL